MLAIAPHDDHVCRMWRTGLLVTALLFGCSHERPRTIAHVTPPPAASAQPDASAAPAPEVTTAKGDAGPAEPPSTALRCDGHPLEVGREWVEVIDESETPQGRQLGCYLFGTATATKTTTRMKKKILAMSAGRVTSLRITYLADPSTENDSLEGKTVVVDTTKNPPEADGPPLENERLVRVRAHVRASIATWPKTDDAKALEKAIIAWRGLDENHDEGMGHTKAKVKPVKGTSSFAAARVFSITADSSEFSGGMCHSGILEDHETGTVAVVDDAFVVEAKLTTRVKGSEGSCQGCGPRGERPCPEVPCRLAIRKYAFHVVCEP